MITAAAKKQSPISNFWKTEKVRTFSQLAALSWEKHQLFTTSTFFSSIFEVAATLTIIILLGYLHFQFSLWYSWWPCVVSNQMLIAKLIRFNEDLHSTWVCGAIQPQLVTISISKWPSSHLLVISNHTQNIDPTLTGHNNNIQVTIISTFSISHQFVITLGMVTWPQLLTLSAHHPQKINLTSTGHNIYIQVNIISLSYCNQ